METSDFEHHLELERARLASVLAAADPASPVPGLAWTVGEVAEHLGAVHRWSADILRERRTANDTGGSAAFAPGPGTDLVELVDDGLTELLATLGRTPPDVRVWGFGRAVPARAFWSRRQAHETAVHRADLEAGVGRPVTPVDVELAQDGIDEIAGFARGFRCPEAAPGHLALLASDGDDWVVTFADGRIEASRAADASAGSTAAATVSGTSSDLYLWAWNRPSAAVAQGDPSVVARWGEVRIS